MITATKLSYIDNGLDRRSFLKAGALTLAVSALGGKALPAMADTALTQNDEKFLSVSRFLTGRAALKPEFAARTRAFLLSIDDTFDTKAQAIAEAVTKSGSQNIDAFIPYAKKLDDHLQDAIMAIVSSWYLGVSPALANGHPGFITFIDALMYEPTKDATNPPTYAHAGTNYWIDPPASVKVPPMPDGIREWGNRSPKGRGQIPGTNADGTLTRRPIGLDLPLTPFGNASGTE